MGDYNGTAASNCGVLLGFAYQWSQDQDDI